MTVHLPDELERYLRGQIANGRFASAEEAISEAVRLLRQAEPARLSAPGEPAQQDNATAAPDPAWRRVLEVMQDLPDEVFDQIPADSSAQLDHYLYGSPKRPTS